MTQAIRNSFTNNATKDLIDTTIGGAEVDANPLVVADILDGTTQTDLAQYERIDILSTSAHTTSRHALRLLSLDTAAGSVIDFMSFEWDPVSDTNLTDGSSGVGISWVLPDDGDAQAEVASLDVMSVDDAAGAEDAAMNLRLVRQGTVATLLAVGGQDTMVDVVAPATTHTAATNTYNLYVRSSAAQTIPAGTTTLVSTARFDEPNITATGTVTSAATVYIANAPTEGGTNNYALWVDSGVSAFGGNVVPDTNDGASLGISGTAFADLFLATGAVINFAAGAETITHAANALTFAGMDTFFTSQKVFIGAVTTNANLTVGLTIDQGANDDTAFAIKSSDVAHGITTQEETDTYFSITKRTPTTGGANLIGYSSDKTAVMIDGAYTTDDTAKTTSAIGAIELRALKKSGTTWGGVGVNANMVVITDAAGNGARFIFDAEGSGHAEVEWVAFAAYDDFALVRSIEQEILALETPKQTYHRHQLESIGVVGKDSWHIENGRPRAMVNFTRLAMVHHGALIQAGDRFEQIEAELSEERGRRMLLEARLAQIEERSRN